MTDNLIANVMNSDGDDQTLEQRQIGRRVGLPDENAAAWMSDGGAVGF
jgi:hypothetical protein